MVLLQADPAGVVATGAGVLYQYGVLGVVALALGWFAWYMIKTQREDHAKTIDLVIQLTTANAQSIQAAGDLRAEALVALVKERAAGDKELITWLSTVNSTLADVAAMVGKNDKLNDLERRVRELTGGD